MFIPTAQDRTLSPRVQELEHRLALTIAEFQQRNPDVSPAEILQAAQLATGQANGRQPSARAGVLAAAVAGVAVLASTLGSRGGWLIHGVPWVAVVAGAGVALALIAVARRS